MVPMAGVSREHRAGVSRVMATMCGQLGHCENTKLTTNRLVIELFHNMAQFLADYSRGGLTNSVV